MQIMIRGRSFAFHWLLVIVLCYISHSRGVTAAPLTPSASAEDVEIFLCDSSFHAMTDLVEQGQTIHLCIQPLDDNYQLDAIDELVYVQEFHNERRSSIVAQRSVADGKVDERHSTMTCLTSEAMCIVEVKLLDKFFNNGKSTIQMYGTARGVSGPTTTNTSSLRTSQSVQSRTPFAATLDILQAFTM